MREEFEKSQRKASKVYKQAFAEIRAENADMKYQITKLLAAVTSVEGSRKDDAGRRKNFVVATAAEVVEDVSL